MEFVAGFVVGAAIVWILIGCSLCAIEEAAFGGKNEAPVTEGLTRPTSPPPPFKYPLGYRPPATSPMPEVPPAPPKADSDIFDRIAALDARISELESRLDNADRERWSNDE